MVNGLRKKYALEMMWKGENMKYDKVVVGGTFDHLHDGHKSLLSKAFEMGDRVLIGIVSGPLELKKDAAGIRPLSERMSDLESYLRTKGWTARAEIVTISDPIGPAADDEDLEAIVVTEETRSRAEKINDLRVENGLNELDIMEVPLIPADDGRPISSIRIRYGEIDEHGDVIRDEKNST